jgi:F-type H+-transporting ATPase subunit b
MAAETELNTATTESSAEATGVLGTLGINPQLLVAQLINVAIVLVVLWRWVYRPLLRKMDERARTISDGLAFAEQSTRALNEAEAERQRVVRDAKAEAFHIVERATTDAEIAKAEKLVQAKAEIEKVITEAKQQIKAERDASFEALKTEIADLVMRATEKVAGNVDDKTHRTLIADALKDIERA